MINIFYFLVLMLSQCTSCSNASEVPVMATLLHQGIKSPIKLLCAGNENIGFQYLEWFAQYPAVLRELVLMSGRLVDTKQIEQVPWMVQRKWPVETRIILALLGVNLKAINSERIILAINVRKDIENCVLRRPERKCDPSFMAKIFKAYWDYRPKYSNNSRVVECDVRQLLPEGLPAIEALSDNEARVRLINAFMLTDEMKSTQDKLIECAVINFNLVYQSFFRNKLEEKLKYLLRLSQNRPENRHLEIDDSRKRQDAMDKDNREERRLQRDYKQRYAEKGESLERKFSRQAWDRRTAQESLCKKFNQLTSPQHSP